MDRYRLLRMMQIFFSALLMFTIVVPAFSQKNWKLEDCINYAIENNLDIKRSDLTIQIAEDELVQSKYKLLPNLNAGIDYSFLSWQSVNGGPSEQVSPSNGDRNIGLTSDLKLFDGLRNYKTIEKSKIDLQGSKAARDKIIEDITLQVVSSYLQILFDNEILTVAKNQLEISDLQLAVIRKATETGNRSKTDLLDITAQEALDKVNVTKSENQVRLSKLKLQQLIELEALDTFMIEIPRNLVVTELQYHKIDSANLNRAFELPQIKNAEYSMQSSIKLLEIARGSRLPSLTIRSSYYTRHNSLLMEPVGNTTNQTMPLQPMDVQYASIGLNLSVPIFNNREIETKISHAEVAVTDSKYKLQQLKNSLYCEIQKTVVDAESALAKYYSIEEAVTAGEAAYKNAEIGYNIGAIDIVKYTQAKNNLIKSKSDLLQAKYEYIFRIKVLDYYFGKPITLEY
jgi:outer membrane protein